jgi:hypothetical protein
MVLMNQQVTDTAPVNKREKRKKRKKGLFALTNALTKCRQDAGRPGAEKG